ncbi:MAG: hypothetical protein WBP59_08235, partial [Ilumatobacteraceae bacterium]
IVGACGSSDDDASGSTPAAPTATAADTTVAAPVTSPEVTDPATTSPTTEPSATTSASSDTPANEARPVPDFYSFAEPDTYIVDQLGVPITFTTTTDYFVTALGPSVATFIEWDSDEPLPTAGDPLRSVWFERVGSFYNRAESVDTNFAGLGSIAPNDIDAWMADNAVIADRVGTTTVGGRTARTLDARPDPGAGVTGPCLPEFVPCIWVSTLSAAVVDSIDHHSPSYPLGSGFVARMWLVDMDGLEPVLIRINAPDDDLAWLDEFETTVLPTISFGEPQELTTG